ncbi:MAG: hypothetical protein K1X74_13155 [Pirellulales bacterium]|nr:hypothetical protein [Pirellulales bacterium]
MRTPSPMQAFEWIDPEYRSWLAGHGLDRLATIAARTDTNVVSEGHRGRCTKRLVVRGPAPATLYLKLETRTPWKDLVAHAVGGRGWWTKARTEFEVLRYLRGQGILAPRPLACFQNGFPRPQACLVLAELQGFQTLHESLAAARGAGNERRTLFTRVGREIARLHATGVAQPDLYSSHVWVGTASPRPIAFIDLQRSVRRRTVSRRERLRDLAALFATLPPRLADEGDRRELCRAYLDAGGHPARPADADQLLAEIELRCQRLLRRRKIWEIRESDTDAHRSVHRLASIDQGRMWIDRDYQELLAANGLASFQAMMNTARGTQLRALRDRENWRLELHAAHAATQGAYLKKHHIRTASTWARARVGLGPRASAGRIEAENVARLQRGGIAAMRLLAYGEQLHENGRFESFVLTEELQGCEQLDHFLRRRFPARPADCPRRRIDDLDRLIEMVADVTARFHLLGYNHRDLYCCHFFIRETDPGEFAVHLIDLQRVEHRRFRRQRWVIKDLAQLAYSAPRDRVSCTQRLAFIKRYLGTTRLQPRHKRFIRRILAKQHRMERSEGLHP